MVRKISKILATAAGGAVALFGSSVFITGDPSLYPYGLPFLLLGVVLLFLGLRRSPEDKARAAVRREARAAAKASKQEERERRQQERVAAAREEEQRRQEAYKAQKEKAQREVEDAALRARAARSWEEAKKAVEREREDRRQQERTARQEAKAAQAAEDERRKEERRQAKREEKRRRQQERRRRPNPIDEWDRRVKAENAEWAASIRRRKADILEKQQHGVACCPYCGCTSLSSNKRGYQVGRGVFWGVVFAAAGFWLFTFIGSGIGLAIGLSAGNTGSRQVYCTCLSCGRQFKAGHQPIWLLWR